LFAVFHLVVELLNLESQSRFVLNDLGSGRFRLKHSDGVIVTVSCDSESFAEPLQHRINRLGGTFVIRRRCFVSDDLGQKQSEYDNAVADDLMEQSPTSSSTNPADVDDDDEIFSPVGNSAVVDRNGSVDDLAVVTSSPRDTPAVEVTSAEKSACVSEARSTSDDGIDVNDVEVGPCTVGRVRRDANDNDVGCFHSIEEEPTVNRQGGLMTSVASDRGVGRHRRTSSDERCPRAVADGEKDEEGADEDEEHDDVECVDGDDEDDDDFPMDNDDDQNNSWRMINNEVEVAACGLP
jgi:hypothetical protein